MTTERAADLLRENGSRKETIAIRPHASWPDAIVWRGEVFYFREAYSELEARYQMNPMRKYDFFANVFIGGAGNPNA